MSIFVDKKFEMLRLSKILEGLATVVVGFVALFSKDIDSVWPENEQPRSLGGFPNDREISHTRGTCIYHSQKE